MKKLFKGLFASMLSLGFLAGCNSTTHLVEFYEDNLGKFYKEVEVKHNKTVAKPADPADRTDYDFAGWWKDTNYSAEFDFSTKIVADTKIYGKWDFNPEYRPDDRVFHLVGGLANTDLSYINWNAEGEEGVDWDVRSYLTKAEDSNLFTIEAEIGYLGKFKVKVAGRPWDADTEFNYQSIRTEDLKDYLQEGDTKNFQVTTAGLYKIEVETTYNWARVTRLGDAVGEGVRQDPGEGEIPDWGLVGTINDWGATPDISLTYDADKEYYFLPVVELPANAEIKLRADNDWGVEFGSHEDNVLVEGAFEQGTEVVEEVEQIKEGANILVKVGGFYSVYFDKTKLIIQNFSFGLRGDALATGWGEDSAPLALKGEPVTTETTVTLTYEGTYTMGAGEFKAKFMAIGEFDGWSFSYGGGASGGDNVAVTAGDYVVTLVVTLTLADMSFTGVLSHVAAPAA